MSEKEANDIEDTEETVTIVQEIKAADKIKILDEIEINESDSEEVDILSKSLSIDNTSGKSTATNVHIDMNSIKCKECNKSFQNNMKLRQHMESAPGVNICPRFQNCSPTIQILFPRLKITNFTYRINMTTWNKFFIEILPFLSYTSQNGAQNLYFCP